MKRTLPTILAILVAALTVAAAALAAVSVKPGTTFSGTTAHKHYAISVGAKCSTKKCSTANAALVIVTAGSRRAPSTSACEFAGYALPLAKISSGKFSATQKFFEPKGPVSFTVSGKFTSATKVTGTVVGSQSCGGKDTFSLKGRPNTGPTGLTR